MAYSPPQREGPRDEKMLTVCGYTEAVEPMAHPLDAVQRLRPDEITETDQREAFQAIAPATAGITLLEAPSARIEALAIAMRLRQAAETGQTAALITPDRTLTRQVTAALDRWNILPDDSAGDLKIRVTR